MVEHPMRLWRVQEGGLRHAARVQCGVVPRVQSLCICFLTDTLALEQSMGTLYERSHERECE